METEKKENEVNFDNPCIYVASLSDYNNGAHHGKWIDASKDYEEVFSEVMEMLKASKDPFAEEWAIHDYQGFGSVEIYENVSIKKCCEIAKAYMICKDDGKDQIFEELFQDICDDPDDMVKWIEEHFIGTYKNGADFIEEYLDDSGALENVPKYLRNHIDFQAYFDECEINGDFRSVVVSYEEIHILYNR